MTKNLGMRFAAVVALSLPVLHGCGGGDSGNATAAKAAESNSATSPPTTGAGTPATIVENGTDDDASQCVAVFLDSLRRGDERAANSVLTAKACEELAKTDFVIEPLGTPEGEYNIGRVGFPYEDKNIALVECTWLEPPKPGEERVAMDIVCEVVREAEGWRISGMGVIMPGLEEALVLDFEDAASLQATIEAATAPSPSDAAVQSSQGVQAVAQQPAQNSADAGLPAYPAQQQISVEDSAPPKLAYPPQNGHPINR